MPKQIKFISSSLSTILALAGIFIIIYQMMAYDYYKLESNGGVYDMGIYSSKITADGMGTIYSKNDNILGCNASVPMIDNDFKNCQTLHILYPLHILALALLIITFVPQLQSAGLITGIVCAIIGIYTIIQYGNIKDILCANDNCTNEKVGFSYYLNIGLIVIGCLLIVVTLNSFKVFGMFSKKSKYQYNSNPYASFYNY